MRGVLETFDQIIISFFRRIFPFLSRASLFAVFFWFGALKVFGLSPASPLVAELASKTLPFIPFEQFIVWLGAYEAVIGLAFLWPKGTRLAIALLLPHMVTTFLPLIFLPEVTWSGFLTPTLEGQYIIKNLVIISLAFGVAARLHPMKRN